MIAHTQAQLRRALMLLALVLGCGLLLARPQPTFACSCMMPPPPLAARDTAVAVFRGTVTDISPTGVGGTSSDFVRVSFGVSEVWKGPTEPTITIATSGSSASCGYEFALREEYVVYAGLDDAQFTTSLCSRTAPLAQAADDVRELGAGTRPAPAPTAPAAEQPWALYVGAALVALVAAGGLVALRRRGTS
jgi:hypothetical protein